MSNLFSVISPLHSALNYHLERSSVLASNVAHVDTPGFKPKDLERVSFNDSFTAALRVTNERHMGGAPTSLENGRVFTDLSAGGGKDGNFVSLDREAAKVAANQMRYDVISAVASAELRGLAFAASDGRGG